MSLNFNDGKWWELSFTFWWPHNGFKVGFDIEEPTSKDRSFLLRFYFGLFAINIEWGDEDWEFEGDE